MSKDKGWRKPPKELWSCPIRVDSGEYEAIVVCKAIECDECEIHKQGCPGAHKYVRQG